MFEKFKDLILLFDNDLKSGSFFSAKFLLFLLVLLFICDIIFGVMIRIFSL